MMYDELVAKSNVVFEFYKACLYDEIDIETYKKCFNIIKRCKLPPNVKVKIDWDNLYDDIDDEDPMTTKMLSQF